MIDIEVTDINGDKISIFSKYNNKVIMVVNTASHCGYTPQYNQLEELYRKYKDRGLVILGFPSSQFANQEFNNNQEIINFCKTSYDITFPLMSKSDVKGNNANDMYKFLKSKTNKEPNWNFGKFIIDKDKQSIIYFDEELSPTNDAIIKTIENFL